MVYFNTKLWPHCKNTVPVALVPASFTKSRASMCVAVTNSLVIEGKTSCISLALFVSQKCKMHGNYHWRIYRCLPCIVASNIELIVSLTESCGNSFPLNSINILRHGHYYTRDLCSDQDISKMLCFGLLNITWLTNDRITPDELRNQTSKPNQTKKHFRGIRNKLRWDVLLLSLYYSVVIKCIRTSTLLGKDKEIYFINTSLFSEINFK